MRFGGPLWSKSILINAAVNGYGTANDYAAVKGYGPYGTANGYATVNGYGTADDYATVNR